MCVCKISTCSFTILTMVRIRVRFKSWFGLGSEIRIVFGLEWYIGLWFGYIYQYSSWQWQKIFSFLILHDLATYLIINTSNVVKYILVLFGLVSMLNITQTHKNK